MCVCLAATQGVWCRQCSVKCFKVLCTDIHTDGHLEVPSLLTEAEKIFTNEMNVKCKILLPPDYFCECGKESLKLLFPSKYYLQEMTN